VIAIAITPETRELARRIIWFETPEQALAQPIRFLAYAMSYARHEDMRLIRQFVSDDDLRHALDQAPPGIIDARSWAYWNAKMGRYPPPPLPRRRLEGSGNATGQKTKRQSAATDPDEVRRHAREKWRSRFGPEARTKKPRS
jgi:hypothetical protein